MSVVSLRTATQRIDEMDEVGLRLGGRTADSQAELGVLSRTGIGRDGDQVVVAVDAGDTLGIDASLDVSARLVGQVKHHSLVGLGDEVELEVAELIVRDRSIKLYGVAIVVLQRHMGEANRGRIHED